MQKKVVRLFCQLLLKLNIYYIFHPRYQLYVHPTGSVFIYLLSFFLIYEQVFPERPRRRRSWQILTSSTTPSRLSPLLTSSTPTRPSSDSMTSWSSTLSTTWRSVLSLRDVYCLQNWDFWHQATSNNSNVCSLYYRHWMCLTAMKGLYSDSLPHLHMLWMISVK